MATNQTDLSAVRTALDELLSESVDREAELDTTDLVRAFSLDLPKHGEQALRLSVGKPPGVDRTPTKYFLRVEVSFEKSTAQKWIGFAPLAEIRERMKAPTTADDVLAAAVSLCDGHFHTEGLPEHW